MKKICADLAAEHEELDAIVSGLDENDWYTATAAESWTVQDQIRHLAYFDDRARLAATDPESFNQHLTEVLQDFHGFFDYLEEVGKDLNITELLKWWRQERKVLIEALEPMDPKARLIWYGPPMSALSFATARLMETWAHGQDIVDGLGIDRDPTDRLRHIAHLGVAAFGWSYVNRQMKVPGTPVRVELTGPGGDLWTWGPVEATDVVQGLAEDFCLVVVQRRNVADTNLVTKGAIAGEWMTIAQAYAGPPGTGRKPGTFLKCKR